MTMEVTEELCAKGLIAEVRRYLEAVDVFRAEGREPQWSRESGDPPPAPPRRRPRAVAPIP